MVVNSGKAAVQRANGYRTCQVGQCLKYTRTWLDIPARYPSAIDAWNNAQHKHVNGRDKDAQAPPMGAPVFWRGGRYGHIALAVDNDRGRSTDTTRSGLVSTAPGDWWRQNWNMPYLGWTEDLNGIWIPYLKDGGRSEWAAGLVLVSKLQRDQKNSDSVARLCYRLRHHSKVPKKFAPPRQVRSYGKEVQEAVAYWATKVRPGVEGPKTGRRLSNAQANALFGPNYQVVNK
jgi:hypothetical protein